MAKPRKRRNSDGSYRYQISVQDKRRGIPRTKRTFDSAKQASEWETAVKNDAHNRLLGRVRRHLFGQALSRYLREHSIKKRTTKDDLSNARALRWPIRVAKRWIRLEECELEDVPAVLALWETDLRQIVKRAYIAHQVYHLRHTSAGGLAWYHQPDPDATGRPQARTPVTDSALCARLDASRGRGPFTNDTFRIRQILVRHILGKAWKHWNQKDDIWLERNIADRIELAREGAGRQEFLTPEQIRDAVIAADPPFARLLLGAVWTGWRRHNVLQLAWDRVVFSVYEDLDGERTLLQPGYIWAPRGTVKKRKDPLVQPMSERLEQLLAMCWQSRVGLTVFHRGDGQPFGDFRRRWNTVKKRAGIPMHVRWHGLRHTWTSDLIDAGVTDAEVQELGGWADRRSVENYTHLRAKRLHQAVNKPTRRQ